MKLFSWLNRPNPNRATGVVLNADGTLSVDTASLARSKSFHAQMAAGEVLLRKAKMAQKIRGATFVQSSVPLKVAK